MKWGMLGQRELGDRRNVGIGGCWVGDSEIGIVVGMRDIGLEDAEVVNIGMGNVGLMDIEVWRDGPEGAS